ncbi:MAG: glycosyltransferase family 4 protein [Ruminococcus sp.]|nr:glycosyltransferase family 4 protein [Ruminococcus sp.]
MKIAFEALPLVSDKMTGIGWCEAGQTTAMAMLHPENKYFYQFFSRKDHDIKLRRIEPFTKINEDMVIQCHFSEHSGYLYRMASTFIPVPYSRYFGKYADITHFFNYIVPPGVSGRTVVTVHDMVLRAFPETVRTRTRLMLEFGLKKSVRRADMVVTDSEFSKSEIIRYYPECADKLRVVPCGTDLGRFRLHTPEEIAAAKKSCGIEGEYLLYVGTIEPRKNLERLIRAYGIAQEKMPGIPQLVLAGGRGWNDSGIYAAAEKAKNVRFTEYIPSEQLPGLMSGAAAFLFPSVYEGFGMPPLEAMASGTPVLTSDAASLPEVTGDCAVLCDPYSEESIAEGILRLCGDTALRQELSRRGRERAEGFTWERSAEILYDIYKELV